MAARPMLPALRQVEDLCGLAEALVRVAGWVGQTIPRAGLRGIDLSVLNVLSANGPQRMSQLARLERITQPGMTRVIHRLARMGLIERSADPADGRIVLVTITPQGRALLAGLHAARVQALVEQLSRLPASEQDALCAAADALHALGSSRNEGASAAPDAAQSRLVVKTLITDMR